MPVASAEAAAPLVTATLMVEVAAAEAPHTGLAGELTAEANAEVEATQTATSPVSHAAATNLRCPPQIEEIRRKKSFEAGDNDGFPAFSARLCNLLLPVKFKPLGSQSMT
jgi:hypothetical protein